MSPDWSAIPAPEDDGAADHLTGTSVVRVSLPSTAGGTVDLSQLEGLTVLYIYPKTGRPDRALPEGWDDIPGARGCTPQSCAFRDHFAELAALGVAHVFGMSTQPTAYQQEAVERLHLPFQLLSDADLDFANAMDLPRFEVEGEILLKRMALVVRDSIISRVFYPVFPPDRNASDVLDHLRSARTAGSAS
ncbi:MAG: peroxiredoxin [Pseudomonadota bacterium]